MKTIKCKNIILDEERKERECGRILAVLTDLQIEILRADTESPIFRCPKCAAEQRWSTIKHDKETDELVFKVLDQRPEFTDTMEFKSAEICAQVG